MLAWKKTTNGLTGAEGPFAVKIGPQGDGRFAWEIFADATLYPAATGISTSLNAAKNTCENYVKRSGRV